MTKEDFAKNLKGLDIKLYDTKGYSRVENLRFVLLVIIGIVLVVLTSVSFYPDLVFLDTYDDIPARYYALCVLVAVAIFNVTLGIYSVLEKTIFKRNKYVAYNIELKKTSRNLNRHAYDSYSNEDFENLFEKLSEGYKNLGTANA